MIDSDSLTRSTLSVLRCCSQSDAQSCCWMLHYCIVGMLETRARASPCVCLCVCVCVRTRVYVSARACVLQLLIPPVIERSAHSAAKLSDTRRALRFCTSIKMCACVCGCVCVCVFVCNISVFTVSMHLGVW